MLPRKVSTLLCMAGLGEYHGRITMAKWGELTDSSEMFFSLPADDVSAFLRYAPIAAASAKLESDYEKNLLGRSLLQHINFEI